jgi:hypothetical protein
MERVHPPVLRLSKPQNRGTAEPWNRAQHVARFGVIPNSDNHFQTAACHAEPERSISSGIVMRDPSLRLRPALRMTKRKLLPEVGVKRNS